MTENKKKRNDSRIHSVTVNHLGKFDVKEFMLREFAIAIENDKTSRLKEKNNTDVNHK